MEGRAGTARDLAAILSRRSRPAFVLQWGRYRLELGTRTCLMGVRNVTPDSFSDGGLYLDPARAVARAREMVAEGADILDIGGESSRPGAAPVPVPVEISRVVPVIRALASEIPVPISVDTCKADVAEAALEAGAAMVNDITALSDPRMARVVARYKVPVVLMHMQGTPQTMQRNPTYRDLMGEITTFLRQALQRARAAGVDPDLTLVDPGIGFGKTVEHNLQILKALPELQVLGRPILVGPSRKSFIGNLLELPVDQRLEGTLAAVTVAAWQGAHVVRVHDVREARRALRIADAIREVPYPRTAPVQEAGTP